MKKTAFFLLVIMWILLLSGNTALADIDYTFTVSYTDGRPSETFQCDWGNGSPFLLQRLVAPGTVVTVTVDSITTSGYTIQIDERVGGVSQSFTTVNSVWSGTAVTGKEFSIQGVSGRVSLEHVIISVSPKAPTGEGKADPLPEDEIGTYSFDENGEKFYIQFHNYNLCMRFMNDENLCRDTSTNLYN